MNSIKMSQFILELKQLANQINTYNFVIPANTVARYRETINQIAKDYEQEEPQISQQLIIAKNYLFMDNQIGQGIMSPLVLGEIIFGLDYLNEKESVRSDIKTSDSNVWSYIHPLIQKSSKKLYLDGHFSEAALNAFIEINDRVKNIFTIVKPGDPIPDGEAAMNTVFSAKSPLVEFCDRSTSSGQNKQKGYMEMLSGAMSALRNHKAHTNTEILSADEAYRRLATASMLMYAIDDAVNYSGITE